MPLNDIVTVAITDESAGITQAGFGIPLIVSYRPAWVERSRTYSSLAAMVSDGFDVNSPEYKAAEKISSQSPRVESWMVGRGTLAPTQRFALTPVAQDDDVYSVTIIDPDGNEEVVSYTQDSMIDLPFTAQSANFTAGRTVTGGTSAAKAIILTNTDGGTTGTLRVVGVRGTFVNGETITDDNGSPGSATCGTPAAVTGVAATAAEIINGLRSLIDGLDFDLTLTDQTTFLRAVADTAGDFFSFEVANAAKLGIAQDHANPGIATDLTAIAFESSDWYAFVTLFNSKALVDAAAAWAESNSKLYVPQTQDTAVITTTISGTDDVAEALRANAYDYSPPIYHPKTAAFADAAWLGKCLPFDPGSETWKFKTLAGVPAVTFTDSQLVNLRAKRCNFYYTVAGRNITSEGISPSGRFIDTVRGTDWFIARLQERVFLLLASVAKIPFTDGGIALIEGAVRAQCDEAVEEGFFAPGFTVTVPKAADVSAPNKAARLLPDVKFNATLAGAIHKTEIDGVVAV